MYVPITDDDIPAVAALMNRAYRGAGGKRAGPWRPTTLRGIAPPRTSCAPTSPTIPAATMLKWAEAGTTSFTGCVWLEPLGAGVWYLGSFAIEPDRQAGGLGRVLLAAAEHWVSERGGKCIRMTVINVRETLIAWYLRRGYRKTGETEPFPYGDDRFGAPLRDDLVFVGWRRTSRRTEAREKRVSHRRAALLPARRRDDGHDDEAGEQKPHAGADAERVQHRQQQDEEQRPAPDAGDRRPAARDQGSADHDDRDRGEQILGADVDVRAAEVACEQRAGEAAERAGKARRSRSRTGSTLIPARRAARCSARSQEPSGPRSSA